MKAAKVNEHFYSGRSSRPVIRTTEPCEAEHEKGFHNPGKKHQKASNLITPAAEAGRGSKN